MRHRRCARWVVIGITVGAALEAPAFARGLTLTPLQSEPTTERRAKGEVGELEQKVVAITASVPGSERGRQGLAALRQTLGAVRAVIVSDEPIARGSTSDAAIQHLLRRLVEGVRGTPPPSG